MKEKILKLIIECYPVLSYEGEKENLSIKIEKLFKEQTKKDKNNSTIALLEELKGQLEDKMEVAVIRGKDISGWHDMGVNNGIHRCTYFIEKKIEDLNKSL